MFLLPVLPAGVFRSQFWQPPLEINSLDAHQSVFIRVPQRPGFPVVQNKGALIRPS